MPKPTDWEAFGVYLLDMQAKRANPLVIERDDGFIDLDRCDYFHAFEQWSPVERRAISFAGRRVIDIGCGAGRVCLHLQRNGADVVGVDLSRAAIRVSRLRGVKRVRMIAMERLDRELADRDTIVMFGNNLGLFGTPVRMRRMLKRWAARTPAGCRIIASCVDPARTTVPEHRAYHRRNRQRGDERPCHPTRLAATAPVLA